MNDRILNIRYFESWDISELGDIYEYLCECEEKLLKQLETDCGTLPHRALYDLIRPIKAELEHFAGERLI